MMNTRGRLIHEGDYIPDGFSYVRKDGKVRAMYLNDRSLGTRCTWFNCANGETYMITEKNPDPNHQ